MNVRRLVLTSTLISAIVCPVLSPAGEGKATRAKPQPVRVIHTWSGKLADNTLRKHEPADGFVLDQENWAKLWKAWRGQENLPALDFQKQMVLVFTAEGPNNVGCTPTRDNAGNVRADAMSTLIGGPGFGYLILCIPREGVKTVNGKPLPGVKVAPAKPPRPKGRRNQPGSAPGSPGLLPGELPQSSPPGPGELPQSSPPGLPGVEAGAEAGAAPQLPPIKELGNVAPKAAAFDASSWKKPLVLRSAKDAAEYFPEQELPKLTKAVDFGQQFVLLFAWRGSGQDRLEHAVAESYPEQVFFTYKAGRTRDLRQHVRVYALRSNVKWSVKQDAPGKGTVTSPDTPVASPGAALAPPIGLQPGVAQPGEAFLLSPLPPNHVARSAALSRASNRERSGGRGISK
jgi:hypothetical protein